MILKKQTFEYDGEAIIEKLTIIPPFRYEVNSNNRGCFVYISGISGDLRSASARFHTNPKEAVLLKSADHFVDFLEDTWADYVQVYAVRLCQQVLKRIFKQEISQLIRPHTSGNKHRKIIQDNIISGFIENLEFYFNNPSLVNDDLLELKLKELILLLVQTNNAELVQQVIPELVSPRKASILEVVDSHLYSNLPVAKLARLCNMSLSSFKREFKNVFNDSPNSYLTKLKLKRAKELMETSDLGINELAYQSGFNDPSYFTRQFKKMTGMPPSRYRNTIRLNQ